MKTFSGCTDKWVHIHAHAQLQRLTQKNAPKNAQHTYIHIPGAYLGLTTNIQVGAICDILTMSQTNSILDACSSPRYKPAYLATKYITKKKKERKKPLPPIRSWQYVFWFESLYALL